MAYTTINKSGLHFNTILRTGNYSGGGGTTAITGVGFAPGLMWEKKRNGTSIHALLDQVRGNGKQLQSETTGAETTTSQYASIDSDGFTVNNTGDYGTSSNLVSWHWKANGAGSANTDGSINSTVSVNTTAGFSIVRWSGSSANATIGHGLGVVPKMIICKDTNDTYNWGTYHQAIGNTKYLYLNTTAAEATSTSAWNDTTPTSTVFSVGNAGATNASGTNNMIAYCFAEKTGYSKFGYYDGNGDADGPFVYTGFAPSFVMTKRTDSTSDWLICDAKRPGSNVVNRKLFPNTNQAEDSYDSFDFVSNGFKIRSSGSGHNADGGTFVYMAFGQTLNGSNNVPCTAR